mmetsp:Transcript_21777/g.33069  ORF Transcript_21777/g.33069 Transcript_21777/m.33069 type:complete len:286 (+) Transcript_21777:2-859(+)
MLAMDQALNLDISILEALVTRNRTNHGRTIYYKRMKMVLQSCQRCKLLEFAHILRRCIQQFTKKDARWASDGDCESQRQYLKLTLCTSFPELLSRIEYAASAFFTEIERGFFLNYCTVAVAALARIRVLVNHLGREGIMEVHKIGLDLSSMMDIYAPADKPRSDGEYNLKLLLKSLGISSPMIFRNTSNLTKETVQIKRMDKVQIKGGLEDIGQQVGPDRKNPVLTNEPAVVDHNLKIVKTKMARKKEETRKEKKRKNDNYGKVRKSKVKKESLKRDVFDDIFGD